MFKMFSRLWGALTSWLVVIEDAGIAAGSISGAAVLESDRIKQDAEKRANVSIHELRQAARHADDLPAHKAE